MDSGLQKLGDIGGRRASDVIAESLIDEIRVGQLVLDEALPTERELCDRYGASRPTVREALANMQLRGYIVGGAGKRPRVTRPSLQGVLASAADHIREVLGDADSGAHLEQMRHFIETGAAREAAVRADNLQLSKLRRALELNFSAIGTPEFPATDIAFHRVIVSVVGNPVILALHDMFVSAMIARRPSNSDPEGYDQNTYEEHRKIYEAILASDVTAATEVMDRHLARSYRARLSSPKSANGGNPQGRTP